MAITTNDIRRKYDDGWTHKAIAEWIMDKGEMDDYTEALYVVEAVILTYKHKQNNGN